jgi:hypothetical protein
MTPFMHAVLDRSGSVGPRTQPSHARTLARATDAQFVVRAQAEQLVSEANAVLAEPIGLVDEVGDGRFAFVLTHRDRTARVETVVHGRNAVAHLGGEPRELTSEDELQALVLSLLS